MTSLRIPFDRTTALDPERHLTALVGYDALAGTNRDDGAPIEYAYDPEADGVYVQCRKVTRHFRVFVHLGWRPPGSVPRPDSTEQFLIAARHDMETYARQVRPDQVARYRQQGDR